ncbi:hypothetical protein [Paenibacillus ihumii]|uniref:hypothetical protein n=1 Tax=Paenibacillus ihumii TaxID=687436 RepID=UPI0006D81489|nr:hypothetical protein [Paenibacillus ihumii]
MEQPLLGKWECLDDDCSGSFLINMNKGEGKVLKCPFCGGETELTAHENPNSEKPGLVYGCLYPD